MTLTVTDGLDHGEDRPKRPSQRLDLHRPLSQQCSLVLQESRFVSSENGTRVHILQSDALELNSV